MNTQSTAIYTFEDHALYSLKTIEARAKALNRCQIVGRSWLPWFLELNQITSSQRLLILQMSNLNNIAELFSYALDHERSKHHVRGYDSAYEEEPSWLNLYPFSRKCEYT
jgi:hypothetical protein